MVCEQGGVTLATDVLVRNSQVVVLGYSANGQTLSSAGGFQGSGWLFLGIGRRGEFLDLGQLVVSSS